MIGGVIAFSILAAIDLFVLILIVRYWIRRKASRAWPETVGVISGSRIGHTYDSNDNDIYTADFTFTYQVMGSVQTGNFEFKNMMRSRNFAARAITEHPVGKKITVRYNPEKPDEYFSEYDNRISPETWIYFIFLTLVFFSLLFIIYTFIPK